MTEHSTAAIAHEEGHHDSSYVKIWAILLALLIVSVVGPMAEIPILTLVTAFGVAGVKAYLVIKHFMHLNVEPKFVAYALTTCLAFMLLLFAGTGPDVMRHDGQNWSNLAAHAEVERALAASHPGTPSPSEPVAPEVAFQRTCAPCHGPSGGGDGPAAASLNPRPADFSTAEFWEARELTHVAKVIREGGPSVGRSAIMPGFGGQFDDEAATALATYLRTAFGPAEGAVDEAPPPEESGSLEGDGVDEGEAPTGEVAL
jgi:caa(3)-type oxidase subunit IV